MKLIRLPIVPYGQALALQWQLRERLQTRSGHDRESVGYLLCLQHNPVITLGKRARAADLFSPTWLAEQGVEVFKTDRGGEATYHGPGQLVIYPIIRLDALRMGVVDLIHGLATALAASLHGYGVSAVYEPELPGLWTTLDEPRRKIASVGMRVAGGVTTHGAAINLVNDLSPFSMFVPCGMPGAPMARLGDYTDEPGLFESFTDAFIDHFQTFIDTELEPLTLELPAKDAWITSATLEELLAGEQT
ncbi:MAG: lipoyl(octanoyl) transferase LipB [Bradymonadaceae bacterium]|nr:lipoyl(octanoyl) transferase LipB [Lujinxingiaceae bacterium]